MRFLRKDNVEKTVLVISDIHLGAGAVVEGRRNFLEDFHYDKEFVDFIDFYSTGDNTNRDVELIINGDMFDFLAVPFVNYFDDEFWSEEASLDKFDLILEAHKEVMKSLVDFVDGKNKKLTFIIGNHDAEFLFPSIQKKFLDLFEKDSKHKVQIFSDAEVEYEPVKSVVIKHGHQYEFAHQFSNETSVVQDDEGRKFFLPPWGSYYVTRVVNKFKGERYHVNAVRPIRKFLINGLIYDTLFTLRFMFSNFYYFFMVRFIYTFKQGKKLSEVIEALKQELELFHDLDDQVDGFFAKEPNKKVLIVGHTHDPIFRSYPSGRVFMNTGTWTKMYHLDFGKTSQKALLTYAQIDIFRDGVYDKDLVDLDGKSASIALNIWEGKNHDPYSEFTF